MAIHRVENRESRCCPEVRSNPEIAPRDAIPALPAQATALQHWPQRIAGRWDRLWSRSWHRQCDLVQSTAPPNNFATAQTSYTHAANWMLRSPLSAEHHLAIVPAPHVDAAHRLHA